VIAGSADPQMRLFTVPRIATDEPLAQVPGQWQESGPASVPEFSAVAYHFGRELRKALGVPVGLISTNYGGTPAEAWTRRGVLEADPTLRTILDNHDKARRGYSAARVQHNLALSAHSRAVEQAKAAGQAPPPAPRAPGNPAQSAQRPTGLYNAMIAPLIPYAIRGAIWYQGESNAGQAYQYRTLFPAMIENWREDWGQGDFPFLFVQLAPFMKITPEPGESAWAELREAQYLTTRTVPNTAMAVITDVGDEADIHPKQKEPVGRRLALAARALVYGQDVEYSGPEYHRMKREGNKVILSFKHVGRGLKSEGGLLRGFAIAGADRKWVNAQAEIRGDKVVVWSHQVAEPVAVRYGWANFPTGNLWNADGLPASPFRTDDFPLTTQPKP
ncbi:MAG TPA: sialate O-acetylesterase, partial [Armatimonadota bacterium]|nr:sialate O-acetylesterase [Armatimonadota bacterium]